MPAPIKNTKVEDKGTEGGNATGLIEMEIGGEVKKFADMDEVKAELTRLHGEASQLSDLRSKHDKLSRFHETAKAAILTDSKDAQIRLYKEVGMTEREIAEMLKEDIDDDDGDDPPAHRGNGSGGNNNRGGQRIDMAKIGESIDAAIQKELSKRKMSLKDLDDESFELIQELIERVESAGEVVKSNSTSTVETTLKGDKVLGPYWERLNEKQRAKVLEIGINATGKKLAQGKLPSKEDIEKIRESARKFVGDVYGPIENFRKAGYGVPSVVDIGDEATGFEDLPVEELDKKTSTVIPSDEADEQPRLSLFEKIKLAQEQRNRINKRK